MERRVGGESTLVGCWLGNAMIRGGTQYRESEEEGQIRVQDSAVECSVKGYSSIVT